MVNKIDGNHYQEYGSPKTVNNIQDNGEKFSLNYHREQLQPEAEKEKEKNGAASSTERSGVRLELSRDALQTGTVRKLDGQPPEEEPSLADGRSFTDRIQKLFTGLIETVKTVLNRIWNDPQPEGNEEALSYETADRNAAQEYGDEKALAEQEKTQEAEELTDADKDARIQKYLHNGNLEQVITLLTDNGRKTIAKNSTLLTYYDRSGKLTQINPSDRERILHGDRNTRKL